MMHALFCAHADLAHEHPGLTKLVFAVLFPVGLMITTLHGVELYTGALLLCYVKG
jgi:formate/nitrite transporter FocA (FNT family)